MASASSPGLGDVVEIVGRDIGSRTVLAVTRQRTIDEPRIDFFQRLVTEPEALHDAGTELLDDDVGAFDERRQLLHCAGRLEIDRDAALSPVQKREIDAVGAEPGRVRAHLIAAAGALDLDHFRAGLGEDQRCKRAGKQRAEVEDAHTL